MEIFFFRNLFFLLGKSAALEDVDSVDWVPSVNMGHTNTTDVATEQFECLYLKQEPVFDY